MTFYLIGINHKDTPLDIREIIYRRREEIFAYWRWFNPGRVATLITCNRIEVYGIAANLDEARYIQQHFRRRFVDVFRNAYVLYGRENIFRHGFRLASGLESQLQGEFQIIQQIEEWVNKEGFPGELFELWKATLKTARKIRQKSGLGEDAVNITDVVFDNLTERLNRRGKMEIMVIGTGKIAHLIARKRPPSAHIAFVARKKRAKAKYLAELVKGEALLPDEIPERLVTVDAVISATSSPHHALNAGHFEKAREIRERPLYIYDLAIPRDIAPGVENIDFNIVLDLEKVIDDFNRRNGWLKERIRVAAQLAEEAVDKYRRRYENPYRFTAQQACENTG